jgi:tetratricopeptide (TPR) repeat protein
VKFLDHLFGKLGLRPERLTDKQFMLAKQAEWDVDMRGHPDLEHARLAQAHWDAGRLVEAHEHFTWAIHHAPEDAALWLNRGNLLFQMGRFREAQADFKVAKQHGSDLDPALFGLARMIELLGGPESPRLARFAARKRAEPRDPEGGA